jgi:hypothetical protein
MPLCKSCTCMRAGGRVVGIYVWSPYCTVHTVRMISDVNLATCFAVTAQVWWPATVHRRDGWHTLVDEDSGESATLPVYVLRYDADESAGWQEQEECWTSFVG